jgi:hypothetical protein
MPELSVCTRCGTEVNRPRRMLQALAKALAWFMTPVLSSLVVALLLGPEAVAENRFFIIVVWVAVFIPLAGKALVDGFGRTCPACGSGSLVAASSSEASRLAGERTSRVLGSGHKRPVTALTVLDDGRLASASHDRTIRVWNTDTGAEPLVLTGHEGAVTALAALPGGRLVSGSKDKTVRVWQVVDSSSRVVARHPGKVTALAALADGRVVSASKGHLEVCDLADPGAPVTFDLGKVSPRALAVADDGRIVAAGWEGLLLVDPAQPGQVTRHSDTWVNALVVLDDGRVACGSQDTSLLVFRLDDTHAPETFREGRSGEYDAVDHVAALPDGRVASYERHSEGSDLIRVWDLTRATPAVVVPAKAVALAVLPTGGLALAGPDKTIQLIRAPAIVAPAGPAEPGLAPVEPPAPQPIEPPAEPPVAVEPPGSPAPPQIEPPVALPTEPPAGPPIKEPLGQRVGEPVEFGSEEPPAPPPPSPPVPNQPTRRRRHPRPGTIAVAGVAALAGIGGTVGVFALSDGDDSKTEEPPGQTILTTVFTVVAPTAPIPNVEEPLPDFSDVEDSTIETLGCRARLRFVWRTDEPERVPDGANAMIVVTAWTGAKIHERPVRSGSVTLQVTLPMHRGYNDFKGELVSIDLRAVNSLPRPFSVTTTQCAPP